jgi:hypothetical protein
MGFPDALSLQDMRDCGIAAGLKTTAVFSTQHGFISHK